MAAHTSPTTSNYVVVDSPHELANWRPLANWVLWIPHYIVVALLQTVSQIVFLLYWLVTLFTGKPNRDLFGLMAMYERYSVRATGFLLGFSEQYPPFDFALRPDDNDAYPPVTLSLPTPPETVPRTAALNVFLAIPHYIMMMIYGIGAVVVGVVGWFAVLFTGSWPTGMRAFLVRVANYYYRIWCYITMIERDYPAFTLPAA